MAKITVSREQDTKTVWIFRVEIQENKTKTEHQVTFEKVYYQKLAEEHTTPEKLVEQSFEFLLGREPKESILRSFNLKQISDYFPEYEEEIKKRI